MRDPFTEMINFFKTNPTYLIVILLVILFFYLVSRAKQENSSNVVKTKILNVDIKNKGYYYPFFIA